VEFAALIDIPPNVGYAAVFALVAIETMGIPVPAETALITAALLAHDGGMDIGTLIVVASAAAIIGDNIGFAIGRHYGRRLFLFRGPLLQHRRRLLEVGEPFFAKHGPKAVFLGRWVSGLRIASAWLAGMNRMRWPTFVFWNALGGIAWATSVALSIYFLGHFAERAIAVAGPAAAGLAVALLAGFLYWRRRQRRAAAAAVDARATSSGGEGE
jgi:membrane protein DedA with SNARE-associated domain